MNARQVADAASAEAASRPQAGLPGRSVVWHLAVFALIIALPLIGLAGTLMWRQAQDEQEHLRERVVAVARAVADDLDRDVRAVEGMLATLGAAIEPGGDGSPALAQARRLAEAQGMVITARLPEGRVLLRAGGPAEAGEEPPLEVHRRAAARGGPAVSGILADAALNPVYRVVVPVMREGGPALLMEAALPSDRARAVLLARLPDTAWAASFMDTSGRLVARTRNQLQSVGALATPEFRRAATGESGVWLGPSHEGNPLLGGFALSRATGWYAAVGVERDALAAPLRRSIAYGLMALVAVALLAGLAALAFGRRIASPILGLAALSQGAARGGLPSGALREANLVARALHAAIDEAERRNAELAGSEAHFRSFVELYPQMPWTAAPAGKGIDAGERWLAFTGLSREDAAAGRWRSALHPSEEADVVAAWERARESGEPLDVEHRLRAADGQWVWMRSRAHARRAPDGAVERWYGTTESVEERRRVREAMRRGEERLRVGLEVAGVGLAEFDYEADTVTFGRRAAEILGLPADEALPRARLHALFHEEDRPALMARVGRLLGPEGDGFLASDYRIRRPDGAVRWLNGRHRVEYAGEGAERRARRGVLALLDVTERRENEQRLARSLAELEAIYGGAPVGLCVLDPDLRFLRINDRLAEINGVPAAEHIGRSVREIVPELEAQAAAHVARVMETGEPLLDVEISGETKAQPGVTRTRRESWHPLRDAQGRIYGVGVVALEVTRERSDAAAIAEASAQLHAMADAVPGLMWVCDARGGNSSVNRGFAAYAGRPEESLLGFGWKDVVHAEDLEGGLEAWREATDAGASFEAQYRFRRHDGVWRWHLARVAPRKDQAGRVTGWVGMATDIEDLMAARRALEAEQAGLEERVRHAVAERDAFWRLTPDMLGVTDMEGRILSLNPAWTATLGFEADEIMAMKPGQLVHPDDRELSRAARRSLREGAPMARAEFRCRRKGEGWRRLSWTMVAREGLVYVAARDVTGQREAEARLRETQDALHQAQKTETIGQLTGGVAHDFNNLLAAIMSNLELARKQEGIEPRTTRLIDGAMRGVERGASLTSRLLAFARRQELSARPVDVGALVCGMDDLLARSLGPAVSVRRAIAPGLPPALVDPHQLELALLNLAVNARDAMPEGGELTIAASAVELGPRNREKLAPGPYVSLVVSDAGEGMDRRTLEKAAEPFFTTKGLGKGTGLGLPMVQGLMAQSRGAMTLESRPGEGTRVTLLLPVAPAAADAPRPSPTSSTASRTPSAMTSDQNPAAPAPPPPAAVPATRTVLVVDDDPLVAMGTVAMLEDLGHRVREAASGREALEIIEADAAIDLVVTDQAMPGMTGVELARRLRALRPDLPIILSTGFAELKPEESAPALPRLRKPFRQGDLERALAEVPPPRPAPAA